MPGAVDRPPSALVIGARGLGRATARVLRGAGWRVAGGARSETTLAGVEADGGLPVELDVLDAGSVEAAIARVAEAHGGIDLLVNAAGSYGGERRSPFGGGPIAEAPADAFDAWAGSPPRSAFAFLGAGARALLPTADDERPDGLVPTMVQVTGGSARRPIGGRPLWGAGAAATRALTVGAALELRGQGVHVALLVVDGSIAPIERADAARGHGPHPPGDALDPAQVDPYEAGAAALALALQGPRAASHELVVTPLAEPFTP